MGFFDRLKNKSENVDDYKLFSDWLNNVLQLGPTIGIKAFNFNLYEGEKGTYDIQLIGSNEYDEDDSDWACTEYFSTGEDICYINRTKDIEQWKDGLVYLTKLAKQYLGEGKYTHILKGATVVGIGFVDGDINIIYHT